jgi:hypothetical protein
MIGKRALLLLAVTTALTSGCNPVTEPFGDNPEESASLFNLGLGDCLNDSASPAHSDLTHVLGVNCQEPHDSEVFAILRVDADSFPGEEELISQGQLRCAQAFGDFIGMSYADSELDFRFLYPTLSSWAQGDNVIYCLVFDPGLQVTGSLIHSTR